MISLLYRDCLVLASAGKPAQIYTVQAIIGLSEVKVEEVDNGRGIPFFLICFLEIMCPSERTSTSFCKLESLPLFIIIASVDTG